MSQNDFIIANQTAPNFRADLNLALQALASSSSGATAPSTIYANMLWYDTATNILKMRSEANDAWIDLGTLDQSANTFAATVGADVALTGTPTAPTAVSGTNTTQVATTAFAYGDLSVSGGHPSVGQSSVTLPNGLIMKWGTATTGLSTPGVFFTEDFPSNVFNLQVQTESATLSSAGDTLFTIVSLNTSAFSLKRTNAVSVKIHWFAIGN